MDLIRATRQIVHADGTTPAKGTITFQLSAPLEDPEGNIVATTKPITKALDAFGALEQTLVATNSPGLQPSGVVYIITERIVPNYQREYRVEIPFDAPGGTVDLADLAPVEDATITYGVTSAAFDAFKSQTTDVHGIANTADLETKAGAQAKADAAEDAAITAAGTDAQTRVDALKSEDQAVTGTWDYSNGGLVLPQTAGKPATAAPDGTMRFDATNRRIWIASGGSWYRSTLSVDASEWLVPWTYRRAITVTNDGDQALTDYQIKIPLDSSTMAFANAQANGADLRIADADKITVIDHYVSSYDSGAQTATLWAKVPNVPAGGTTLYLYYGNSGAASIAKTFDQFFAKFATDANTLALWHCDDGSGTSAADAKGTYPLTLTGVTWGGSDGGGQDATQQAFASGSYLVFNGTTGKATAGTLLNTMPGYWTIEAWARLDAAVTADVTLWSKRQDATTGDYFGLKIRTDGALWVTFVTGGKSYSTGSAPLTWNVGTWYHVAMTAGNGGIRVYRNGVLAVVLPFMGMIKDGSASPLQFGVFFDGTGPFKGALDEIRVLNIESTPADVIRDWQRGTRYGMPMDQPSRWVKRATPVLNFGSGADWDSVSVSEPSVIRREDGTWHMWYTGVSTDTQDTAAIGYATSPDGLTWTKYAGNPVIGQGASGVAGVALHSSVMWDGTQYVMYYSGTTEAQPGGGFSGATSPDGITWTPAAGNPLVPMDASGWSVTVGNAWIFLFNGTWHMLYEASSSVDGRWRMGLATGPSVLGPWTKYAGNPLDTLTYGRSYGNPMVPTIINGTIHLWYGPSMSNSDASVGRAGLAHASSTDAITWTPDTTAVIAATNRTLEERLIADPHLVEHAGETRLYYTGFVDRPGKILVATFDGPISELVTIEAAPLPTVGAEQSN